MIYAQAQVLPLRVLALRGQQRIQLRQPFDKPPTLLRHRHRFPRRPSRVEVVAQFVVGRTEAGRRLEVPE
jgi:hypothetical protein